jgi:hypothetical protein
MSGQAKFQKKLCIFVGLVCSVLFAPTTLVFLVGMMPTIASNVVDKTRQKSRTTCVAMMNFAGVLPFLLELWMSAAPNSIDYALSIIAQPKVIIIIYVIAASGYAIEAAVSGMVANIMQQKAKSRLKVIAVMLIELKDRWNDYVDGNTKLDDYGFPVSED